MCPLTNVSLRQVREDRGPAAGGEVVLGVEVEEIFRESGSGLYQLFSSSAGAEPAGDGAGEDGADGESGSESGSSHAASLDSIRSRFSEADTGRLGEFDYVCVCVPARQVAPLLSDVLPPHHFILEAAAASESAPVWAVVLQFEHAPPFSFQGALYQPCLRSDVDLASRQRERRAEQAIAREERDLRLRSKRAAVREARKLARDEQVKVERQRRLAEGAGSEGDMQEWIRQLDRAERELRLEEDERDDELRNKRALGEEEEELEEHKLLFHALLARARTASMHASVDSLDVHDTLRQVTYIYIYIYIYV